MLATFRETITSLKDLNYGKTIITKTVGQAIWYWTKYLLLISIIGFILSLGLLAYYTPQSHALAREHFPDIDLTLKAGKLTASPFTQEGKDIVLIINTKGSPSDLDKYPAGLLLLEDKYIIKDNSGRTETRDYADLGDFHLDKPLVINWLSQNQFLVFVIGLICLLIITLLLTFLSWTIRVIAFFIWAVLVWIVALFLKRQISYLDSFKLVLYASVLPLLLSPIAHPVTSLISFGVFVYYSLSWLSRLDRRVK